jgi:hypothetical protein
MSSLHVQRRAGKIEQEKKQKILSADCDAMKL